eukprot:scaffold96011_cov32-Prasinocladus_malaysianus.AAC.1
MGPEPTVTPDSGEQAVSYPYWYDHAGSAATAMMTAPSSRPAAASAVKRERTTSRAFVQPI